MDLYKSDDVSSDELRDSLNKLEEHMEKYIACKTKELIQLSEEVKKM